jgi:hypothetical protein
LRSQDVLEGIAARQGRLSLLLVAPLVLNLQLVVGCVVVEVVAQVDVVAIVILFVLLLVQAFGVLLGRGFGIVALLPFFQRGVLRQLVLDALLQLHGGQLQHLQQLDLLGRKLLLELERQVLFEHGNAYGAKIGAATRLRA